MVGKIIFFIFAVIYICESQMQDPDPNGDFNIPEFDLDSLNDGEFEDDVFDHGGSFDIYNPFGSMGTPGETAPVLHDETQQIEAKLGTDVTLPCHVTNPGTYTVSWMFLENNKELTNGSIILVNKRHYGLQLYPGEWNLVVKDTRHNDGGEYLCMLNTIPPQMKSVYLVIIAPPRIDKSSLRERYKVQEGEELQIACIVTGSPTPSVRWYSYRTDPRSYQEVKESFSNSSVLFINSLQQSDGGIYSCEASNSQGTDMYEIMIEPEYKPKPATLSQEIVVKYGTSAKLECIYYSSPRAQIVWRKGGEQLRTNWKYNIDNYKEEKLQGSELTIRTTYEEESGTYKCIATNVIGQHVTTFIVTAVKETTTTTERSTTTTTLKTTSTTVSTRPPTKPPIVISTKPSHSITPVEINNPSTQATTVPGPRTGESQSTASQCQQFSVVFISLTVILSLLLKVS